MTDPASQPPVTWAADSAQCDAGRKVCPDSDLFNKGFVCMNHPEDKCCKKSNGKDCTPLGNNNRRLRRSLML